MNRACLLAALTMAFAVASPAGAAPFDDSKIAVVMSADAGVLTRRIQAELEASGFHVEMVRAAADTGDQSDALPSAAQSAGAIAAVQVNRSRAGVRIWIADRVTGKTVTREVSAAPRTGESANVLIAVRVVELLRASFLELEAGHPSRGEAPPSEAVRRLVASSAPKAQPSSEKATPSIPAHGIGSEGRDRRSSRLVLGVGAGGFWSPGGLGVSPKAAADLRWFPGGDIGVRLLGLFPVVASVVESREGSAQVAQGFVGLGTSFRLAEDNSALKPDVGAGIGLAVFSTRGSASAPYLGRSDTVAVAAPYVHAGLEARLSASASIRAEGFGAAAVPRPVVQFAQHQVASWGQPAIGCTLTLQVHW